MNADNGGAVSLGSLDPKHPTTFAVPAGLGCPTSRTSTSQSSRWTATRRTPRTASSVAGSGPDRGSPTLSGVVLAADRTSTPHQASALERRTYLAGVAQCGIVVTGGLVRLTGSGLGCPTWPDCVHGSTHADQAPGAGLPRGDRVRQPDADVRAARRGRACRSSSPCAGNPGDPRSCCWPGAAWLGVLAQAVLGGITVRTELNPLTVAAHFLLSMVLIAVAVALQQRAAGHRRRAAAAGRAPTISGGSPCCSFPLGGWSWSSARWSPGAARTRATPTPIGSSVDPRTIAWLHADAVLLFIGLTIAVWLALRVIDAPTAGAAPTRRAPGGHRAQAVIGYTQYFTGVPGGLVAFHVAGACAVWVATLRVPYALRTR